jgi:hypothetical protein
MPQTKRPHLNKRQIKFVKHHILDGLSIAQSVLKAGYNIKSGRVDDASSYGCKLLKQDRIKAFVSKLREKQFDSVLLTAKEKRAYLARAVRADIRNPDPDLVQELVETTGEHGTTKRLKLVSKLDAIKTDNLMAGDNFSDQLDNQQANPFLFLVNFFSPNQSQLPSTNSDVIDAEIVP